MFYRLPETVPAESPFPPTETVIGILSAICVLQLLDHGCGTCCSLYTGARKMRDRKMQDWKCRTGNCRTGKCRTWNTNINSTSAHVYQTPVIDHSTRRLGCDKYQRLHRVNWQSPVHRTLVVVTSCRIRTKKSPKAVALCKNTITNCTAALRQKNSTLCTSNATCNTATVQLDWRTASSPSGYCM